MLDIFRIVTAPVWNELADIEAVAAHHANNYMPLVARHRRRDRATMFAFVGAVELEARASIAACWTPSSTRWRTRT